jgi:hypothetical protein
MRVSRRVALEPADVERPVVERALAVVPERRMPEVVREARGVDHIGVEAQAVGELAAHLSDLERVRETVAGEVEARRGTQDLRLRGEAAQRARVQDAGAVAREIAATAGVLLRQPALGVRDAVARGAVRRRAAVINHHSCSTPLR